jgi:hypothetical protein
VIDEIDADRPVAVRQKRDFELRAHAIGARDEHGMTILASVELKQPAERADVGEHT